MDTLRPKNYASWIIPKPIRKDGSRALKTRMENAAPWTLLNIGRDLRIKGEYSRAVQYLNQARASFESAEDDYGQACTLEELAFCSGELSRNAMALEYAHQSVAKFRQLG